MTQTPGYSEAFIPGNTGSDSCSDDQVWGDPSTVYSYILKPRMKPEDEWMLNVTHFITRCKD